VVFHNGHLDENHHDQQHCEEVVLHPFRNHLSTTQPAPTAVMTTLGPQLSAIVDHFRENGDPTTFDTIIGVNKEFKESYDPSTAIQVGDKLPAFSLTDATGKKVTNADLLAGDRALLITFYRGEWCPFCNLALRALQQRLDEFEAKKVTLVAVSPQLPDGSLSMAEKHALKFPVLSDVGNKFAKDLGILFVQPDRLRPVLQSFGHDLVARNGDDSFVLPIPATILVDRAGVVRNVFLDPDYTKRQEPQEALDWVDAMEK
jgi:peroxiredoxin